MLAGIAEVATSLRLPWLRSVTLQTAQRQLAAKGLSLQGLRKMLHVEESLSAGQGARSSVHLLAVRARSPSDCAGLLQNVLCLPLLRHPERR